jgi:amino acid adenylation domain-containing protein
MADVVTGPDDAGELVSWLAGEVARRSGMPLGSAVDPRRPIASHALDSLATIELMHAIERRTGVVVEPETLFSEITLADLAADLRRRQEEPTAPAAGADAGYFPLSRAQLSLWFLHALAPESPAYNVPNAVRIRGELDPAALLGSLQALVERHPALRTTFVPVAGEPLQRVAARGAMEVGTHAAAAWGEDQLAAHLEEESVRPFDLERGPLLRVALYARATDDHVLLLTMHHIVTDFWSLGVMLDELGALYAARRAGHPARLPPPAPPYAELARWQERELAGAAGEALWDWWRERLAGELPVLDLPTDRPRPRVQGTAGRAHRLQLGEPLASEVRRLAREAGTTRFVVLLAAFEALLHRYSGQPELLLGTVGAARTRAAFARTVGYFVNPLVLRADLAGDPGFRRLLARARRDALGAFAHQDYPFPLLVEKLQPERDPSRSPLFQVMFVFQKAQLADGQELTGFALGEPGARIDLGALALETIPLPQRIAQFDLTLAIGEVGGRLAASFDYNVELFDAATLQRLAGHFERLLAGALAEPDRPVSELPLLDPGERRQLIEIWNDTRLPYRDQATLADLVARQAAATPEAPAAVFAGGELTYGELERRASRLARTLRRLGAGPEEQVGICVERSFDVLIAPLGVLAAGGAYLPIDPEYPRERIAHLLASARVSLLLTHRRLLPLVAPGGGGAGGASAAGGPRIVCLDDDLPDEAFPPPPARPATASNLACVIFTSGSSGVPKGVLLDHSSLVSMVDSFMHSYRPAPGDRILPLTSIAYASFVGEVFPLLCAGGAVVLPQKHELLDTGALASLIARHQVTMVSTVPSMLASLDALGGGGRLPHLRLLLIGGEALPAADAAGLLARAGDLRIVNGYGLTETAVCSTIYDVGPADLAAGRQPPIGRPLPNQRVYVLDRHLQPRPIGCPGELYVAGVGVARGYAGRPDLTAERFLPDPFAPAAPSAPFAGSGRMYRTGDLAAVRADGNLAYLGRADQQVKLRGFRIELAEIESALALHPGVRAAAVVVRHDDGEPRLVAYAVPEPLPGCAAPRTAELLAGLRERLPGYMVPAALVMVEALPRNASGKLDAARLPVPPRIRPELAATYAAPRSELERAIAAVWRAVLKLPSVGLDDNFFDLGGHSLLMARMHAQLREALGREVSLIELFQFPTIGSLARHLAAAAVEAGPGLAAGPATAAAAARTSGAAPSSGRRAAEAPQAGSDTDVAVIGLAGRFPGAADVRGLWLNLAAGREGISFFSAEELIAAGVDPELVARPDYVRAKGFLGGVDLFDAAFFGLNPREVELMDPQHRLFLECAWEALEDAGWDADRFAGQVGVYGGESMNTYMVMNLLPHMELVASADTLQASLGNDKDPLTARVSYKLNLKGPSITIQSASSTSLVAVHAACQALRNRDCDMALAGGVSIHLPEKSGYLYQEGGTVSRDGHTRAFDAASSGFVSGNGCGVVVLKRLSAALADRDHVYAVIKGTACNNDGSHKVSFMAPSVDGQVQLYELAYANAGVDPGTVSYVECHGTGTAMGDPIEIGALTRAFAAHTARQGFCAIGSLKTNLGHLDTAAGVCGLIKAVLALHHRTLPPSLHFQTPNPRIDFAGSPFYVNTELRPWEAAAGAPRRAGVTSLGMGGTNAHVVLEEAPRQETAAAAPPARAWQLLALSAKSATALDQASFRLAEHLRDRPELPLGGVAYTLQAGRKAFQHRRTLLCRDLAEAARSLESLDPERVLTSTAAPGEHPVAFLFPGQGAQYPGMGRGLYEREPAFRAAVDRCCELLDFDLRAAMWGGDGDAAERLRRTEIAQPALFVLSWATAQLWLSWGVRPAALLGHSIGEYVAACLAGVFSLEDALALVVERGRLMQQMAPGAMLAVPLPETEVAALLDGTRREGGELSLAAVNRPDLCVVSGSPEAIDAMGAELAARGVTARRLHTSHAFHSATADPILQPFAEAVRRVRLAPPGIPLVSNLTGVWMRPEDATDPTYWARQLRATVRFADGLALLLAEPQRILLEAGPGDTLASFAREHPARLPEQAVISSLRHPKSTEADDAVLLRAVARLWLAGGDLDWEAFGAVEPPEQRRRVSLPTYPFERRRYWVEPLPSQGRAERRPPAGLPEPRDWAIAPVWKPAPPPPERGLAEAGGDGLWLLLADFGSETGELLAGRLTAAGRQVVRAFAAERFSRLDGAAFAVDHGNAADFAELLAAVPEVPAHIVHLWGFPEGPGAAGTAADCSGLAGSTESEPAVGLTAASGSAAATGSSAVIGPAGAIDRRAALDRCFYSPLFLAQALGRLDLARPASLLVVTGGQHAGTGGEGGPAPAPGLAFGSSGLLPRELPNVVCRTLDLLPPSGPRRAAEAVEQILAEATLAGAEVQVAWRDGQRFERGFEVVPATHAVSAASAAPAASAASAAQTAPAAPVMADVERGEPARSLQERSARAAPSAGHQRPTLANPFVAPEEELEQQIAAVLQEVLGVDRVGLHDNFFELGGNSLAGVRVIHRLKERLQVSVSEVNVYEAPTVATMARLIAAQRRNEPVSPPAFEASRGRGERRKARQLQKVQAGEGA